MKVYALLAGTNYEGSSIHKIYSTPEQANNERIRLGFTVLRQGLWEHKDGPYGYERDEISADFVTIEEHDVE